MASPLDRARTRVPRSSRLNPADVTWAERHFGYGTAGACAGHTDSTGPAITTYIKAQVHEVARTSRR